MKKVIGIVCIAFTSLFFTLPFGTGYQVGDIVKDFEAKNVDGTTVGTKTFPNAKGYVVVFTCNTCPYAQAYQSRINTLAKKLDDSAWPLIAVNSNDKGMSPGDSFDQMKQVAKAQAFAFPYIYDESQEIVRAFGASKTPHFYVLDANKKVKYIGALDDNADDANAVSKHYVEDAIKAIQNNTDPNPSTTRAIGCGIKKRAA